MLLHPLSVSFYLPSLLLLLIVHSGQSVSQSVTLSDDDVQCVWMDDVVDGGGGGSQESQLS